MMTYPDLMRVITAAIVEKYWRQGTDEEKEVDLQMQLIREGIVAWFGSTRDRRDGLWSKEYMSNAMHGHIRAGHIVSDGYGALETLIWDLEFIRQRHY